MDGKGTIIYFATYKSPKARWTKFKKSEIIKEYFSDMNVIKFTQTLDTEKDIEKLTEIISEVDVNSLYLISSSLGIIPALYCYYKYDRPLVAINSNYFPAMTMKDVLTETELEENSKFKTEIKNAKESRTSNNSKISVFISLDDKKIDDFQRSKFNEIFKDDIDQVNYARTGGHKYEIISEKLADIRLALTGE